MVGNEEKDNIFKKVKEAADEEKKNENAIETEKLISETAESIIPKPTIWSWRWEYIFLALAAFAVIIYISTFSLLSAVFLIIIILASPFIGYLLAQEDKFFGILNEGDAIIIELFGAYYGLEFRYAGKVKDPDGTIRDAKQGEKIERHEFGGLIFIGIWPLFKTSTYTLRWKVLRPEGKVLYRVEKLSRILLMPYMFLIEMGDEAEIDERPETIENISVSIKANVTLETVNPYKYRYGGQDTNEMTLNRIKQLIKEWVGGKKLGDLISTPEESAAMLEQNKETLATGSKELSSYAETRPFKVGEARSIKDYVLEVYGIKIIAIDLYSITLPKDIVIAATAPFVANQTARAFVIQREGEAKGLIVQSTGQAKSKLILAGAEITRIQAIYSILTKYGTAGLFIRNIEGQEHISESGKAVHYLAPYGAVNQLSTMLMGTGLSDKAIQELSEKLADVGATPEELLKTADVMQAIEKNPEIKKALDVLKTEG